MNDGVLARVGRHRADYLYVLPALGVMALVIAYPVYFTIYLSFFNTPPNLALDEKVFAGFENYRRIALSDSVHQATWNTMVWTLWSTFFAFIIGFAAALALNREFRGRALLRGTLLVPYVISAVAAAYVWRWIFHSDFGVMGAISVKLGLTDQPIDFVMPKSTVQIANPIAVVKSSTNKTVARAFVNFLRTKPAQVIFAQNGYRPVLRSAVKGFSFPYPPGVFSIQWLGGWAKVDKQFFDPNRGIVTKIQKRHGS